MMNLEETGYEGMAWIHLLSQHTQVLVKTLMGMLIQ
jgi:hypothetical protein